MKSLKMDLVLKWSISGTWPGLTASAIENGTISIVSEVEGFGTHPAQLGDLLLFHYVGEQVTWEVGS
jgi:hypothetical protein